MNECVKDELYLLTDESIGFEERRHCCLNFIEHLLKPVLSTIVGVINSFRTIEQDQLRCCVLWPHTLECIVDGLIESRNDSELSPVTTGDLASSLPANVDSILLADLLRAIVRRLTGVIATGSGAVNEDRIVNNAPAYSFTCW